MYQFVEPVFLPALIIVGGLALAVLLLALYFRIRRPPPTLGSRYPVFGKIIFWFYASLGAATMVVALARPYGKGIPEIKGGCIGIIAVVDRSLSMLASDIRPSRLDAAKAVIDTLRRTRAIQSCDHAGFFSFDVNSRAKLPLSTDLDRFSAEVSDLRFYRSVITDESAWGTDLAGMTRYVLEAFDRQQSFFADELHKPMSFPRRTIVLIFSDGDGGETPGEIDTLRAELAAVASEYRERNLRAYAVGIGTHYGYSLIDILDSLRRFVGTLQTSEQAALDTQRTKWIGKRTRLDMRSLEHFTAQTGGRSYAMDNSGHGAVAFTRGVIEDNRPQVTVVDPAADKTRAELWWQTLLVGCAFIALAILFL